MVSTTIDFNKPLEKRFRSVKLTPQMKKALIEHADRYPNLETAADAIGIRRQALASVLKSWTCNSDTYNKILKLLPDNA